MKKGENDIKEEQVEKGLRTSPHKCAQKKKKKKRNPQSDKKTIQLKPKFALKTALVKSLTKQNKNKQIARHIDRSRETEPEPKITPLPFLYIGSLFTHPMMASFSCGEFLSYIQYWLHFYVGSFSYTSRAGFIFIQGVFLTGTGFIFSGEFLLHVP